MTITVDFPIQRAQTGGRARIAERVYPNVERAIRNVDRESWREPMGEIGQRARPYTNMRLHPSHVPHDQLTPHLLDGMGRRIQVGDIISWKSGGYYQNFLSFGLVRTIHYDVGRIRVINHKGKGVNIWITDKTVIIAKENNYETIPEWYLEKFGII